MNNKYPQKSLFDRLLAVYTTLKVSEIAKLERERAIREKQKQQAEEESASQKDILFKISEYFQMLQTKHDQYSVALLYIRQNEVAKQLARINISSIDELEYKQLFAQLNRENSDIIESLSLELGSDTINKLQKIMTFEIVPISCNFKTIEHFKTMFEQMQPIIEQYPDLTAPLEFDKLCEKITAYQINVKRLQVIIDHLRHNNIKPQIFTLSELFKNGALSVSEIKYHFAMENFDIDENVKNEIFADRQYYIDLFKDFLAYLHSQHCDVAKNVNNVVWTFEKYMKEVQKNNDFIYPIESETLKEYCKNWQECNENLLNRDSDLLLNLVDAMHGELIKFTVISNDPAIAEAYNLLCRRTGYPQSRFDGINWTMIISLVMPLIALGMMGWAWQKPNNIFDFYDGLILFCLTIFLNLCSERFPLKKEMDAAELPEIFSRKSYNLYAFFAIFLSIFQINNFYLGYRKRAKVWLAINILSCGVAVPFVGIIAILAAACTYKDADGKILNRSKYILYYIPFLLGIIGYLKVITNMIFK